MDRKEVLRIFAYGGALRNSIDKITKAGRGALFVFMDPKKIKDIYAGGFKIDAKLTEEKLAELAKLDGAIIIDDNFERILYANVLLTPNIKKVSSSETGTRHQAAERTAKEFEILTVAVSEKTKIATIYYKNRKLSLGSLNELFTRTGEALKSLEKHEEIFQELIKKFDVSEILGLITIEDIIMIFQRKKIIEFVAEILSTYLLELGKEGRLVELQLKEGMHFINSEISLMIKDYSEYFDFDSILKELEKLEYDETLEKENLFKIFMKFRKNDAPVVPRGYRILKNIPILSNDNIDLIVSEFTTLKELMLSNEEELKSKGITERKARAIKEYLFKF
ncbi:MAG: DNA integrity scanning diadenylate cyclase DisA [Nanoarchaeota archaeon]|nr:DNA integrity scanning diadenylate cyclase DisA [Nanoarchaeota archaeon]MBU0963197.1 DNA integrity scanning diadenylate cyclase DisA [Nanoarchaeota archaeon]